VSANDTHGFKVAAITHPGRVRERNEDAVSVCDNVLTGTMCEPFSPATAMEPVTMLIADGMGGHARGDVASRTALKILIDRGADCRTLSDRIEALHLPVLAISMSRLLKSIAPNTTFRVACIAMG
jgi:serine/threonine protein phosphatase PrpC